MNRKIIVCRCEDVTLEDIETALERGYRHIEEVKRYTGLGTGLCQGRECMCHCALLIAQRTGQPVYSVPPFTTRPPLRASPLKYFIRREKGSEMEDTATRRTNSTDGISTRGGAS